MCETWLRNTDSGDFRLMVSECTGKMAHLMMQIQDHIVDWLCTRVYQKIRGLLL